MALEASWGGCDSRTDVLALGRINLVTPAFAGGLEHLKRSGVEKVVRRVSRLHSWPTR
jgi:hypothetical protein